MLHPMRLTVLLLALAATVLPAAAATLSARQQSEAEEFAINNALFILHHEAAHLLFDRLGLPVLGREEDAADNLATYVLLRQGSPAADKTLADAARGWHLYGKLYGGDLSAEDFYDEHSLDGQRAYQIVCLMVGSKRQGFREIATEYRIDLDRQESCERDYALAERSLDTVLKDHRAAPDATPVEVQVSYGPASETLAHARTILEKSRILEQVADELRANYALEGKVRINARRCNEVNAYYDSDTAEIILCYEMIDDLLTMIGNELPPEADSTGLGRAGRAD